MTTLFNRLKDDQLTARKAGERDMAATLGVVIAEASKNDKNPSDELVMAHIRKLIKSLDEILSHMPNSKEAEVEKALLEAYVPEMLTEDDLSAAVHATCVMLNIKTELRNMKTIKEALEAQYPGQIDGKLLADIIKKIVAS